MKRGVARGLVVLVLMAVLQIPAWGDRGAYRIKRFHTDLYIQRNSDLVVEEHLQVEFSEARHGIYRTIPIRYTDPVGYSYSYGFQLEGVTDEEGRSHQTQVRQKGSCVHIRIGSADRTVRGRVDYVIRYRVTAALRRFPEHDELYWNATGHQWQAAIDFASAKVHLPAPLPADSLEVLAFSGRYRSKEQDVEIQATAPGELLYTCNRPLQPLEGLTVVAAWPHGYVAFPGPFLRVARFLGDNWILLMPLFALVFLFRRYQASGRDPGGPRSVMVQYEPPKDVSPGGIGTIVDERVDLSDLTATIVDLAVRGYLVIRTEERKILFAFKSEETVFERLTEKSSDDLLEHEKRLLEALFASGDRVTTADLKQKFYKHIPAIKRALYERLVQRGYFAGSPEKVRNGIALLGLGVAALGGAVGTGWAVLRGGVLPNAVIVPAIAGVLTFVLFALFAPAMPRRTSAGVRLRMWALGFEEFVDRVERGRLEESVARQVFETLLPYAMALGVATKWARKFEGIYAQSTPTWYIGSQPHTGFSTHAFEQSLSSALSRAGQSMLSSPRSSGSSGVGGGGFSGGGGGGGGGGSW